MQSGFIYAIESAMMDAVKIGITIDPAKRISSMQTGNPDQLKMIGCWPGNADNEKQLHGELKNDFLRGEWFKRTPAVLTAIQRLNKMQRTAIPGLYILHSADGKKIEVWEHAAGLNKQKRFAANSESINSRIEIADPELITLLQAEQKLSRLKLKPQLEALIEFALRHKRGQK